MTDEISGGIAPLKKTKKETYCFAPNCKSVSKSMNPPNLIGCERDKKELTNDVVKFYSITRLYFLVKGKNMTRESNRQKRKHLKLRCVL